MAKFLPSSINKNIDYTNLDISIVMLKYRPYNNICGTGENLPFR